MPYALTVGVPYELFWHLTPNKLRAFYKSYQQKQKIIDEQMWMMGQYIMSALDSTVCNSFLWKGKNGKPSHYIEKPILSQIKEKKEETLLSEEEKKKRTEQLFMQLRIMGANHKRNHKDSSVS